MCIGHVLQVGDPPPTWARANCGGCSAEDFLCITWPKPTAGLGLQGKYILEQLRELLRFFWCMRVGNDQGSYLVQEVEG